MNVFGCGTQDQGCFDDTSFVNAWLLTTSQEYIVVGATYSSILVQQQGTDTSYETLIMVRYSQEMNLIYATGMKIFTYDASFLLSDHLGALSGDENFVSIVPDYACFSVLNTTNGQQYKAFCLTTPMNSGIVSISQIMIATLQETYIYDYYDNSILVADLTKTTQSIVGAQLQLNNLYSQFGNGAFAIYYFISYGSFLYMQSNALSNDVALLKFSTSQNSMTASFYLRFQNQQANPCTFVYVDIDANNRYIGYGIVTFDNITPSLTPNGIPAIVLLTENNYQSATSSSFTLNKIYQVQNLPAVTYSYFVSGIQIDIISGEIAVGIISFGSGGYAAVSTLNINQTGTVNQLFKIFYSAQNGYQIKFIKSLFITVDRCIIAGDISNGDSNSNFYYGGGQGILVDIPEPYYFSMSNPSTVPVAIIASSMYTFSDLGATFFPLLSNSYSYTNSESVQYQSLPVNNINQEQLIDYVTDRTLTPPILNATNYDYYLGSIALIISFGECIYNQSCSDLSISHSILQQNGSAVPSFMILSNTNRQIIIYSSTLTDQGTYLFYLKCSLVDGFSAGINFQIDVKYDDRDLNPIPIASSQNQSQSQSFMPNFPPEFVDQLLNPWVIRAGAQGSLTLPKTYDPNPQDTVKITLSIIDTKYKPFFNISQNKYLLFNAGFSDLGDIDMIITLTDNHINPLSSSYRLTIEVLQSPYSQMQNDNVQNTSVQLTPIVFSFKNSSSFKIKSISANGEITIGFQKALNLTNKVLLYEQLYKALQISFDDPDVQYYWNITNLKTLLQITLLDPQLFINMRTNNSVIIQQQMPQQIYGNDNELLLELSQFFNTTLASLLITQTGMQILISQSLQIFWGFVNTQQIISHMPLLNINIPSNLYYFFQLVVGSLKFDYLFSSSLLEDSFGLQSNYPAYRENFNYFGYNSSLAIQNMGFNTFILLLSPILIFITLLSLVLARVIPKIKFFAQKLKDLFMFSFPLRLFIESYLNILISSVINIYYLNLDGGYGEVVSSVLSIIFTILCIASPTLLGSYVQFKNSSKFSSYIKTFFEEVKTTKKSSQLFFVIYFLRRIGYVIIIMYPFDHPLFQVVAFQYLTLLQIAYLLQAQPFETKILNYLELMNEGLVLILGWVSIIFLDIYYDPEIRYNIGWGLLIVILFVTVVNLGISIFHLLKTIAIRGKRFLRKVKNYIKQGLTKLKSVQIKIAQKEESLNIPNHTESNISLVKDRNSQASTSTGLSVKFNSTSTLMTLKSNQKSSTQNLARYAQKNNFYSKQRQVSQRQKFNQGFEKNIAFEDVDQQTDDENTLNQLNGQRQNMISQILQQKKKPQNPQDTGFLSIRNSNSSLMSSIFQNNMKNKGSHTQRQ